MLNCHEDELPKYFCVRLRALAPTREFFTRTSGKEPESRCQYTSPELRVCPTRPTDRKTCRASARRVPTERNVGEMPEPHTAEELKELYGIGRDEGQGR